MNSRTVRVGAVACVVVLTSALSSLVATGSLSEIASAPAGADNPPSQWIAGPDYPTGTPTCGSNLCVWIDAADVATWDGTQLFDTPYPSMASLVGTIIGVSCQPTWCGVVGTTGTAQWSDSTWTVTPNTDVSLLVGTVVGEGCNPGWCGVVGTSGSETWDGSAWNLSSNPGPSDDTLVTPTGAHAPYISKILCASANLCVAVGAYEYAGPDIYQVVEEWTGSSWNILTPTDGSNRGWLSSVSCGDSTGCLAVGYSGGRDGTSPSLYQIGTGGAFSGTSDISGSADEWFTNVSCPTAASCTAIGEQYVNSTEQNFVTDGSLATPTTADLTSIECLGASQCIALGSVEQSLGFPETPVFTSQPWLYPFLQVGTATSFPVTAVGYPTPIVSETGQLPPGLSFSGGTVSGTPTTPGLYPVTFVAANGVGSPTDQSFTFAIFASPVITSAPSALFPMGVSQSFEVTTTGFPAPTFSTTGSLPPGLSFEDNGDGTATISGMPQPGTAGEYSIQVTASNDFGAEATQTLALTVGEAPTISGVTPATFVVGIDGHVNFATTSGFPTASWSESGALPVGLTFIDNRDGTASLSGIPGAGTSGTYPIDVTATNGVAPDAFEVFTLTVESIEIATTSLPNGTAQTPYSASLAALGGNPPYTWKVTSGALPKGIKLNKRTGVISGKTKAVGTLTFTVEVLDTKTKRSKGNPPTQNTATQALSLTISSS